MKSRVKPIITTLVIGSLAFYLFYANQNSKREYADKIEKLEKLIAIFNPDYQKNREEKKETDNKSV